MDAAIRFITHKGKQILLVDLSHRSAAQIKEIAKLVPAYLSTLQRNSVLLLADFTGIEFDRDAFTRLKEAAVFDRPFLKRSAWVGTDSLPKVFYENLKVFSQRDLPTFKTREEAMEWLVED